jgi:hypothetical protein
MSPASSIPNEIFTRYNDNDPIYSLFNNDYGMDLAWNYIPQGLDSDINLKRDYVFDTGNTCHNIFSFGFTHHNILRDLCSIVEVDERHFAYRQAGSDTVAFFPFKINLIHSLPSFTGTNVVWSDSVTLQDVEKLNAVPVVASSFYPSVFSCAVLYTVDLYSNSVVDLHDFFKNKMMDSFSRVEEMVMLRNQYKDGEYKPRGILGYDRLELDPNNPSYAPRANQSKINYMVTSPDVIYDMMYALHPHYAANAGFLMHPLTLKRLRKSNPTQCQISTVDGIDYLCGKPIHLSVAMPHENEDILYGDFKSAFAVLDFGDTEARDMTAEEQDSYLPASYKGYHDSSIRVFLLRKKVALVFLDENAIILSTNGPPASCRS